MFALSSRCELLQIPNWSDRCISTDHINSPRRSFYPPVWSAISISPSTGCTSPSSAPGCLLAPLRVRRDSTLGILRTETSWTSFEKTGVHHCKFCALLSPLSSFVITSGSSLKHRSITMAYNQRYNPDSLPACVLLSHSFSSHALRSVHIRIVKGSSTNALRLQPRRARAGCCHAQQLRRTTAAQPQRLDLELQQTRASSTATSPELETAARRSLRWAAESRISVTRPCPRRICVFRPSSTAGGWIQRLRRSTG